MNITTKEDVTVSRRGTLRDFDYFIVVMVLVIGIVF